MKTLVALLFLAVSANVLADTYRYDVNSNGHITVLPADASTSGYATLAAAKAFTHSVNGIWANGDTVYLAAGKTFPGGNLNVGLGKSGATYFVLDGNEGKQGPGATISHAAASSSEAALTISNSGIIVRNLNFANTGTTGKGMIADGSIPITDVRVVDCTVTVLPGAATGGLGAFYQESSTNGYVNSHYTRCKANFTEGGKSDLFIYDCVGVGVSAQKGKWVLTDCEASGCTYQISMNCFSMDSNADIYIEGGTWHDAGGTVLALGSTSNLVGRLYVSGSASGPCTVYNSHMGTNSYVHGATIRAIIANSVQDTYVYNVGGIELVPGDVDANTGTPDGGIALVRNCYIERDLTRESANASTNGCTSDCNTAAPVDPATDCICGGYGILVSNETRHAIIENTVLKNFTPAADSTTLYTSAIRSGGTSQTIIVRNCVIDQAYIGVDANLKQSHLVVQDSLLFSTVTSRAGTGTNAFNLSGANTTNRSAWTVLNTVVSWRSVGGGYLFGGANNSFDINTNYGGYNYFHAGDGAARSQMAGLPIWTNDASSNASTNAPGWDAYYRQLPSSPALNYAAQVPLADSLFNSPRLKYISAITGSLAINAFTSDYDSSVTGANYLKGQSLVFLGDATTALAGEIVTIASHDANSSSTMTVFPRLSVAPANTDHAFVLPFIYPGSGQIGNVSNAVPSADGGFGPRGVLMWGQNPFLLTRDLFNQPRPTRFFESTLTDGVHRRAPGPFGLQRVVDMSRPSSRRPGARAAPDNKYTKPVENRLR